MANKKRKKVRVAFRKNRQKKARAKNDLTRELNHREIDEDQITQAEPISGKGDLTRHRTIIAEEDATSDAILREVDESKCIAGRVLSAVGLNSVVAADYGRRYECTVRRVVRTLARDERNPVVTGDRVLFQPTDDQTGVIERVEPRATTVSRGSRGKEHVIAANVDQVLIVVSAREPMLKPGLIDRFLVSAEKGGVRSIICINKVDLADPVKLQRLAGLYGRLGYDVVLASATEGTGLVRLRHLLTGCQTAVTGQSGVGKSSLLNALQPELGLETRPVSEATEKGKHTTRRAMLLELDFGGWVVDTPGFRQFGLWDVAPEEMEAYFIEFRPFVTLCKFPDCSHTHEESCGVKRAVEADLIATHRYESYLHLLEEEQNL